MKKSLLLVGMMLVIAVAMAGCATSGDLAKVQAQEQMLDAKVDQALKDAQAAKVTADTAKLQADEAAARAEKAELMAQDRERAADERAERAEASFRNSMRK